MFQPKELKNVILPSAFHPVVPSTTANRSQAADASHSSPMSALASGKALWDQGHSGKLGEEGEQAECMMGIHAKSNSHKKRIDLFIFGRVQSYPVLFLFPILFLILIEGALKTRQSNLS